VYGIALGYEDLNDYDQLRQDPLLALLSGKRGVGGEQRRRERDRGKAGAGKSTLAAGRLPERKRSAEFRGVMRRLGCLMADPS
jgi:hypothetical protein